MDSGQPHMEAGQGRCDLVELVTPEVLSPFHVKPFIRIWSRLRRAAPYRGGLRFLVYMSPPNMSRG